jgi:hypothetical protein
MRYVISIAAGVLLALGVVLVIRAVSDDNSGPTNAARTEAQRRTAGAYECMPRDTRRRFDRAVKRYDARFGYVLDHAPAGDTDKPVDEVLEADARYVALRNRARAILVDYLPGGSEFDDDCYRRAIARYDRIAQPE